MGSATGQRPTARLRICQNRPNYTGRALTLSLPSRSAPGLDDPPVSTQTAPDPPSYAFEGYRALIETHGTFMGEVARRSGDMKSVDREFLRPRKPVVLTGLMDAWPAYRKWTFDFFRTQYADIEVPTGIVFSEKQNQRLEDYINYLQSFERGGAKGPPVYMEGWYFRAHNEELCLDYEVPACLKNDWFENYFPKRKNPKGTGILMGPAGAFTKMHTDGQCTHTWLAQFAGRKRWVLVDYDQLAPIFKTKGECNGRYPGFEHPDLEEHLGSHGVEYWTCHLEPGEIVVLPGNWFHQVTSLDNSISMTHNFFNGTNARKVLWEMMRTRMGKDDTKADKGGMNTEMGMGMSMGPIESADPSSKE